jgi:dihydroorotate dehydrogenase (NAD+) catalytic subunit
MTPSLKVNLADIEMRNPVLTASGTFGYGKDYLDFFPLSALGAITVKGVAPFPSHGNPIPRTAEVQSGMLNAIGLQGPGIDKFLTDDDYMPFLRKADTKVFVNIWGKNIEDYRIMAERLEAEKEYIAALEVNISCPNVKEGGIAFGTDRTMAAKVVAAVREATTIPLITKLSPNVTIIGDFAKAVQDAGTDVVSLINTLPGIAIDIETRRPKITNVTGGLSGPAIKPIAVRMVHEVYKAVKIPIIGMGGIQTAEDAIEFMLAGASAIAVGTAMFYDPLSPIKVIKGIEDYLKRHQISDVNQIIGAFEA